MLSRVETRKRIDSEYNRDYNPPSAESQKRELQNMMKVNEIFTSVQGEGSHVGQLCTFVRFTACNLRCNYCDTEYAFYEGESMDRKSVLKATLEPGVSLICVTGGEPLLKRNCPSFWKNLSRKRRQSCWRLAVPETYPMFRTRSSRSWT